MKKYQIMLLSILLFSLTIYASEPPTLYQCMPISDAQKMMIDKIDEALAVVNHQIDPDFWLTKNQLLKFIKTENNILWNKKIYRFQTRPFYIWDPGDYVCWMWLEMNCEGHFTTDADCGD